MLLTRRENCSQNTTCCNKNVIYFLVETTKWRFIDKSIFKLFVIKYYEFGENTITSMTVVLNIKIMRRKFSHSSDDELKLLFNYHGN